MIEFESHWVPHSYCPVPHLSKKLSKLPSLQFRVIPRISFWGGGFQNGIQLTYSKLCRQGGIPSCVCFTMAREPSPHFYFTYSRCWGNEFTPILWTLVSIPLKKQNMEENRFYGQSGTQITIFIMDTAWHKWKEPTVDIFLQQL